MSNDDGQGKCTLDMEKLHKIKGELSKIAADNNLSPLEFNIAAYMALFELGRRVGHDEGHLCVVKAKVIELTNIDVDPDADPDEGKSGGGKPH
jgi:hypothetical protein